MSKTPPTDLKPDAKARWAAVYPLLAKRGPVDVETLRTYCQVWARWRQAEDNLDKYGQIVRTKAGGVGQSPLVSIAAQNAASVRDLERRLNFPPPGAADVDAAPAAPIPQAAAGIGWRRVNRIQLGELMGVHPDTVTDYTRQGMPVITAGGVGKEGVYDAVACLDWWRLRQGRNAKEAAQTRAFTASAELSELKLLRERGQLLPRDQVILEGQHYTKAWAAKVRGLARRLVQHGLIKRDKEAAVATLCRELLLEISSWKSVSDTKRATSEGPHASA